MLLVGDDWAGDHHDVELMDSAGKVLARARLPEGAAGMARLHELIGEHLVRTLRLSRSGSGSRPTGACGSWRWPPPGMRCSGSTRCRWPRYRERHGVCGAKSDAGDAHTLADMVRTGAHQLRPVAAGSPAV